MCILERDSIATVTAWKKLIAKALAAASPQSICAEYVAVMEQRVLAVPMQRRAIMRPRQSGITAICAYSLNREERVKTSVSDRMTVMGFAWAQHNLMIVVCAVAITPAVPAAWKRIRAITIPERYTQVEYA